VQVVDKRVIKHILELSDTGLEGLEHIKTRIHEGYFTESFPLLHDVISSFAAIEQQLTQWQPALSSVQFKESAEKLRNAFSNMVSACEQGKQGKAKEIMQFALLPYYRKWRSALNQDLASYQ
jgi:hypothetical protein